MIDPNINRRKIFYIGKTHENDLFKTTQRHVKDSNNRRKFYSIQRILNEGNSVTTKILTKDLSEDRAFELEKFLIKSLTKIGFDLVNLTQGGEGTSGFKHSKQECESRKLRALQNNPMKLEASKAKLSQIKKKPVQQYSLDGILLDTFDSAIQVEEQFGFRRQNISSCCRNESSRAYGYIWRYANA